MIFRFCRRLFRGGLCFVCFKLRPKRGAGLLYAPVPVLVFAYQRIHAMLALHSGERKALIRQHGKQAIHVLIRCKPEKIRGKLCGKMAFVRAVRLIEFLHFLHHAVGFRFNPAVMQRGDMLLEVPRPVLLAAVLVALQSVADHRTC